MRMRAVEMPQPDVTIPREHGDRRILASVAIFRAQIVLERALTGAQEPYGVPTLTARAVTN